MLSKVLLTSSLALGVLAAHPPHHSSSASFAASGSSSASGPQVSAQTSINLFLGPEGTKGTRWEVSVVGVDNCLTTYGLTCSVGKQCKGGLSATVTQGNGVYDFTTTVASAGQTQSVSERCELSGTTEAACTVNIAATSGTSTVHTSTSKVFRGAQVQFEQVPVTAGASLLSSAAKTCSAATASASTSSGSAASSSPAASGSSSGTSSGTLPGSASGASGQSTSNGSGSQSTASSTGGVAATTSLSSVYKVLIVPAAALLALA